MQLTSVCGLGPGSRTPPADRALGRWGLAHIEGPGALTAWVAAGQSLSRVHTLPHLCGFLQSQAHTHVLSHSVIVRESVQLFAHSHTTLRLVISAGSRLSCVAADLCPHPGVV